MRESLEFRLPKLVLSWLPTPAIVVLHGNVRSAMQSDSGWLPAGCVARGGTAYWSTVIDAISRFGAGLAAFSDDVFDIVHRRIDVLVPPRNTASELRKYSLPPCAPSNALPGVMAGHTVKPAPSGPAPSVSNSTTLPPAPPVMRLLPMA